MFIRWFFFCFYCKFLFVNKSKKCRQTSSVCVGHWVYVQGGRGWGIYKLTAAQKNTFDISIRSRSRLRWSHPPTPPKSTKQTNKRMNPTDNAYDTHSFGCRVGRCVKKNIWEPKVRPTVCFTLAVSWTVGKQSMENKNYKWIRMNSELVSEWVNVCNSHN